jgi:ribose 5-phosphate isomerase A
VGANAVPTVANSRDLRAIAAWALEGISDGQVVGLGSGRAATAFIHALGERVRDGLRVRGVPTSQASAYLARKLGIPLASLDTVDGIDVDVDGADEAEPRCDLIKGYGGALVREKIVAASSRRVVILVGEENLVPALGSRGKLPVEVVPFGLAHCLRGLSALGCVPELRTQGEETFVTDNGNFIFDCGVGPLKRRLP